MRFYTLIIMLFFTSLIYAEEPDSGWWEKSKDSARDALGQSKQIVDSAVHYFDTEEQNENFSRVWEGVTPKLDKLIALENERKDLPDSSLFRRDKESNQEDINELLDEAIQILGISDTGNVRQEIYLIEEKIKKSKESIAEYRQKQVSAPIKSGWKTTVDDYEKKIADEKNIIEQYQEDINQKKQQFLLHLNKIGLQIDREQLDLLLASVVGDDIVQSIVVYDNVKQISQKLMELTKKTGEGIEVSKRYYGMYTILLKILRYMQNGFITEIDENYLPNISRIEGETRKLMASTKSILEQEANDSRRQHLKANFEAQELTLKTADLYKQHLDRQRHKVIRAKEKTQADLTIALNTYHTVKVSGELVNLMRSSAKSLDDLLNIQVPDLLVFENLQMKDEFSTLTAKLKE